MTNKIEHKLKTYNLVREQIVTVLQKESNLKEDTIEEQINTWKQALESILESQDKLLARVLNINNTKELKPLDHADWERMQKDLEESFVVRITKGILVTGKKHRIRDLTWWTSKKQLETDNYYFTNYMKYMKSHMASNVLDTINEDTDVIMNNLADPDLNSYERYGMVVGHVQSGKTSNYAALICKAADAGYRFIVVIAGAQNNLRKQTQERLDEIFIGSNFEGVGKLEGFKREKMPDSLTNADNDFKIETAKARATTNFENMTLPILVVIKKNTKSLSNLLKWLDRHYKNQVDKPMLVIDDESDYASINTNDEENPTVINEKIRSLLNKFEKKAYVAYTATPFANIFIDHEANNESLGRDIFPSDFIYALNAPSNYFGAEKIFIHNNQTHIVEISDTEAVNELDEETDYLGNVPYEIKHKKDYAKKIFNDPELLPDSLFDAVRLFVINIGIRKLRNQNDHNSMLIHISRLTDMHIEIRKIVETYLKQLKDHIQAYGKMESPNKKSNHIKEMYNTFISRLQNVDFEFEEILSVLIDMMDTIQIREVHQRSKISLVYRNDIQTNVIVIGGLSLSRGFTLEGLSVSYFLRTTAYYDTLMQMGRWFGYRNGYEDLCRIYITNEMNRKFIFIIEAINDLIVRLNEMQEENLTPEDFGLAVKLHPDSLLQITARNKSKNTEDMFLQMDLDGQFKETRWISNSKESQKKNELLLKKIITTLQDGEYDYSKIDKSHLWKNVPKDLISQFIQGYSFYVNDPLGIKSRMPIDFIKEYINTRYSEWDIVLFNGIGENKFENSGIEVYRQSRSVKQKQGYWEVTNRQLSRGTPEKIIISDVSHKNMSSREMRRIMEKPLLMLHALELEDENKTKYHAVGFSISFPLKDGAEINSVRVRINNVYKRQLEQAIKEIGEEDKNDD